MTLNFNVAVAFILSAVVAYLLGSLCFGIIVSRLYAHKDVRDFGSGNAGMTNVLRNFGKIPAAITFVLDLGKGVLSVFLGKLVFHYIGGVSPEYYIIGAYVAGIFSILGHLYPVYFGFKGGKGVATGSGIILVIDPIVFCILVGIFIIVVALSKIVSLASVSCAVAYPIATFLVHHYSGRPALLDAIFAAGISVIVIFMHRANIKRLINGTENKFGTRKKQG